ncbi:MAG: S8 family peptidase, partial [Saprospiraceae bacterium]|nr:S8 family peptidase [Saprospiraceae bacterium]
DYTAQNINLQNHSYATDIENYYAAGALAYDRSLAVHPALLHVFSAGNSGLLTSLSGTYANIPGFANLTGNFKMAKNVLTVAALDSFGQVAPFSSRGPAYDGRLKPDLAAFGNDGTSGAAALVSGAAAVTQQALRTPTGELPLAALVRALLLNGADDVAPPGPDFFSGFGNLNLRTTVQTAVDQQFITGEIGNGETRSFPLSLPPNIRRLKVMLAWDDPPAAPNARRALRNDLDVQVMGPDGAVWLPWVLQHFPHADSLRLPANRRRDTLNNVEQVTLNDLPAGAYTLRVSGARILDATQSFSLVWHWADADRFAWSFPVKNDPVVAGQEVILRWESTFADTTGSLHYRPVGSSDWLPIASVLDLRTGYFRWSVPDVFAEAKLRIQVAGQLFESDTFLIAKELRMKIGFNCPDSVMLYWNAAAPDAAYQIYGLGERYLEALFAVHDTFVVLQKATFPQRRFAVAPSGQDGGVTGLRSAAPDVGEQGVACYFKSFLAELNEEAQVDLSLRIGTTYGVSRVFFEKQKGNAFYTLNEQIADNEMFAFTDNTPQRGLNTYRVQLLLANGAWLLSDTITVYFAGENGVWVFPNPISEQGTLQVVSAFSEEADFLLFDVLGRLILERKLDEVPVEVALEDLPRGVYYWGINTGGKMEKGGILLKQ